MLAAQEWNRLQRLLALFEQKRRARLQGTDRSRRLEQRRKARGRGEACRVKDGLRETKLVYPSGKRSFPLSVPPDGEVGLVRRREGTQADGCSAGLFFAVHVVAQRRGRAREHECEVVPSGGRGVESDGVGGYGRSGSRVFQHEPAVGRFEKEPGAVVVLAAGAPSNLEHDTGRLRPACGQVPELHGPVEVAQIELGPSRVGKRDFLAQMVLAASHQRAESCIDPGHRLDGPSGRHGNECEPSVDRASRGILDRRLIQRLERITEFAFTICPPGPRTSG